MINKVFLDIYNAVWKEVFPDITPLPIDTFKSIFTKDLLLPIQKECVVKKTPIYIGKEYTYKRFISDEARWERINVDNNMSPKIPVSSLTDIVPKVQEFAFFKGSRTQNSDVVEESDDIHSSSYIYNSEHIYNSSKILFGYNIQQSEFLLASSGNKACEFGIALVDSASTSNSFDIGWSAKSSNCYFCNNVFDLRDCMFCFNIESKQYCIANMQFTEEEYKKLKPMILKEYIDQLQKPGGFRFVSDL